MQIRIRSDSVEIEGYVNVVERKSKTLWSRMGDFIERVCKGAFRKALKRNDNVRIWLNHDPERDLGGQKDGNLELEEDNVGLHARATITDPEVIKLARNGDLIGWSFGFYDREVEMKRDEDGLPLRNIHDLDLEEVSILDRTKTPAYDGTLITCRAEERPLMVGAIHSDEIHIRCDEEEVMEAEEPKEEVKVEEPEKAAEVREEPTEEVQEQPQAEKQIKHEELDKWVKLISDMRNQGR